MPLESLRNIEGFDTPQTFFHKVRNLEYKYVYIAYYRFNLYIPTKPREYYKCLYSYIQAIIFLAVNKTKERITFVNILIYFISFKCIVQVKICECYLSYNFSNYKISVS